MKPLVNKKSLLKKAKFAHRYYKLIVKWLKNHKRPITDKSIMNG
jgi:hypothetical protein